MFSQPYSGRLLFFRACLSLDLIARDENSYHRRTYTLRVTVVVEFVDKASRCCAREHSRTGNQHREPGEKRVRDIREMKGSSDARSCPESLQSAP
jgi:hypothetical protein